MGMGFALRSATGADGEFLGDMLVEAVNWDPSRPPLTREQVLTEPSTARYVTGWPRAGDLGVLAVEPDGRPIGATWLRRFNAADPGYGFVSPDVPELSVAVVPDRRARGVGRALIREVVRRAVDAGIDRISLSVERANPARALYVREGFTVVASGAASDTMVWRLEPRPGSAWH
jgi:GNAT superfamily N-acetyltransferase